MYLQMVACRTFLLSKALKILSMYKCRIFSVKSKPAWRMSLNTCLVMGPKVCVIFL